MTPRRGKICSKWKSPYITSALFVKFPGKASEIGNCTIIKLKRLHADAPKGGQSNYLKRYGVAQLAPCKETWWKWQARKAAQVDELRDDKDFKYSAGGTGD
jgi:hypothetical protein